MKKEFILENVLNSHGFVSINKTTAILNSITGNQLNISDATVVNIQNSLDSAELEEISIKYSEILEKGQSAYEEAIKGKKNISYLNDERSLLKRLREFKDEHLRFITNFEAPFDNNKHYTYQ